MEKNQAKYGYIRALRQSRRLRRSSFFVFRAKKQLKMLVYFCEVFALQSPSRSDKAEGFEPRNTRDIVKKTYLFDRTVKDMEFKTLEFFCLAV